MSRHRFFVDRVACNQAVTKGERAHHLRHVLRVQAGQLFELRDRSRVYLARVTAATNALVTFAIEQELPAPSPLPEVMFHGSPHPGQHSPQVSTSTIGD